jgi:hypothetical protein
MDVKSAFLNGDLQEEVYVKQPSGFIVAGKEHKVLKLKKALYELHQVPQAWNAKLDDTLLSLGFRRTPLEHTIYVRWNGNVQLVVGSMLTTSSLPAWTATTSDCSRRRWRLCSK